MKLLAILGLALVALVPPSLGAKYDRCQDLGAKSSGGDVLAGCPEGTVYVSDKDPRAKYRDVASAADALSRAGTGGVILVGRGTYHGRVRFGEGTWTVLGETSSPKQVSANLVRLTWSDYIGSKPGNRVIDVATVAFGSGRASLYNVEIENLARGPGRRAPGQAQALATDRAGTYALYQVALKSLQDTFLAQRARGGDVRSRAPSAPAGKIYFHGGELYGATDQIYGFNGVVVFSRTFLGVRDCGGGIAAMAADGARDSRAGFYCLDCRIDRAPDAVAFDLTGQCYLGRPWNEYSRAIYVRTYMGSCVAPAGFRDWGPRQFNFVAGKTDFAEVNSRGPGYSHSSRDTKHQRVLEGGRWDAEYTPRKLLGDDLLDWIDASVVGELR